MAELLQSNSEIRSIVSSVLYRTSKSLTALLEDAKVDLRMRFKLYIEENKAVPPRLLRSSSLYREYIGDRNFNHIVRQFALQRRQQNERIALQSELGRGIICRVIKTRLWEYLRGRNRAARRAQQQLQIDAHLPDSESEHVDNQVDMQLEQSADTSESDDEDRPGMTLRSDKKVDSPPPAKPKKVPQPESKIVLLKGVEKASSFKFGVLDLEGVALAPSDKKFLPNIASTSNKKNVITSLNTLGVLNISGSAFKSTLLRTSVARVNLMFEEEDTTYFLTFAAPLIDARVRLYTLLIDLSVKHQKVVCPIVAQNRFHVFLAILTFLCYSISPKGTIESIAILGVQTKNIKSAEQASDAVMSVSRENIKSKCYSALLRLVVIYDFIREPNLSLNTEISDRISQYQQSMNDYERALFALGSNILAPVAYQNDTYPHSLLLYQNIAWTCNLRDCEDPAVANLYSEYLDRLFA